MKKIIVLTIGLILLISMLSGCQQDENNLNNELTKACNDRCSYLNASVYYVEKKPGYGVILYDCWCIKADNNIPYSTGRVGCTGVACS